MRLGFANALKRYCCSCFPQFKYRLGNRNRLNADWPAIEGERSIKQMGEEIVEYRIKAASDEVIPKATLLNQDDFIPGKGSEFIKQL